MIIGLDYDDTFTRDPIGWTEALNVLKAHGHTIIGTTARFPHQNDLSPLYVEICDDIVFTKYKAKRQAALNAGHPVQIWIDDNPAWVDRDIHDT